ncbi:response regulator [Ilumatobacter sp.]|uniref:response regulator n=1 Tax=Ilumatobacter sp. TaxID=1967498 RepID=UPI003AF90CBD
MNPRILVVEDEESFVDALQISLSREGFDVSVATDGLMAIEQFERVAPDLVLLDLMLPELSGIDVCRRIRATSSVPIIMVTAKASEIDTVVGLEVGADDYVAKPYRIRELIARIRALLRRTAHDATGDIPLPSESGIRVGDVTLDVDEHRVTVDGVEVALPLKEFEVLRLLLANAGRVLTREMLIERVWGSDYVGDTKTLDVHIKRLRSKVEPEPGTPRRILTIRGVGYRFDRPSADDR